MVQSNYIFRLSLIIGFCLFGVINLSAQAENSWALFEDATFKDVYLEEFGAYASLLVDDKDISALHGQEITIKGYHIPVMEDQLVILSKYPNANCFFCGGAGLESIVEVRLINAPKRRFLMDEILTFKGTMHVNTTDYNLVSFILINAELVERAH